ncbi:amylo-alpha-1,6-glucosidase [Paenibacillus sp. GCM10027626]|uniref:alpha-L-rhamnosidase-related protein n=1 Tax=Paenibacillus sp. GCM10027626 TaxID=3273411 RepID=UPI003636992D
MSVQQAEWIWYPGDFEVWLRREVEFRRDERSVVTPPIWKVDSPYVSVRFRKTIDLPKREKVRICTYGSLRLTVDGVMMERTEELWIEAGEHTLLAEVSHITGLPALYIQGSTFATDGSWEVSHTMHGYKPVGCGGFTDPGIAPADYRLPTVEIEPVNVERTEETILADFGKQTFGFVQLRGVSGQGRIRLDYGESLEEASDSACCETFDELTVGTDEASVLTVERSRAMRYVRVTFSQGMSVANIALLHEYLPVQYRGQFSSSDEELNRIWDVSAYTFHLNTRELFLDGIKRDRWVWSGDAYQSYLMNYYLFFELPVTQRTMVALRGKDPIEHHLNTILDYSLYWFVGLKDYYLYTGDLAFIAQQYENIIGLLEFCLSRVNGNGMLEGKPEDWVFVDWADMSKDGELSFIQILFCMSLETVAGFAAQLGHAEDAARYGAMAERLKRELKKAFWDEERQLFIHSRRNGEPDGVVTRHANMFALLYDFLDTNERSAVKGNVLMNPDVPAITTPYMRFYELAALCEAGEQSAVREEMLAYWGGMLKLGATSFWEEYDPKQSVPEQYAMYGRKYGKSLCHAWGASPLYLLGKYFLGVTPAKPGYEETLIVPRLGGLDWMEGCVPTPHGEVTVYMDRQEIKVSVPYGAGRLRFQSDVLPEANKGDIACIEDGIYELQMDEPGHVYAIRYGSVE